MMSTSTRKKEEENEELKRLRAENNKLKTKNTALEQDNERLRQEARAKVNKPALRPASFDGGEFGDYLWKKLVIDPDSVKAMLLNHEIDVNEELASDHHSDLTILQIAAAVGAFDVVQLLLNLGVDPQQIDAAIHEAERQGSYHVSQLLRFSKLKGSGGDELTDTAQRIHRQNGIADNIVKQLAKYDDDSRQFFEDTLQTMMESLIESKQSFSDDLLNLCLLFERSKGTDILHSSLWKCVSKTCSQIIQSGSKLDWFWLKSVMLPSMIWFKQTSKHQDEEKPAYLYHELLKLVDGQAKAGLAALQKNLQQLADHDKPAWHQLVEWDLPAPDEYDIVRQDGVPNALTSKYTQQQLSVSSSSTFNAHSFYDYNEYLPQLVMLAQMVDDAFQESVQRVFNIDKKTNTANLNVSKDEDEKKHVQPGDGLIRYSRGPVKLIERARAKAQNDYADQAYPTSACVLDLNRCSLIFNDIASMLKAIELFVNKVKYYQSGCIIAIVRDKNGFKEYVKETQYADVKLNVLIKAKANCIIGEVQFLLNTMKRFKEKAHNLYSIQRQQEYFDDSVTHILPLLLDVDKQMGIAANLDDVKTMCRLMLFNNKTAEHVVALDQIMWNICLQGNEKMLRLLASALSPAAFVQALFFKQSSFAFDATPIHAIFMNNDRLTAQYVLSMDTVRRKYAQSDELKADLIRELCGNCDLVLIDYTLRALGLSDKELAAMLNAEHAEMLIFSAVNNENEGVFQRLLAMCSDPSSALATVMKLGYFDKHHLKKVARRVGEATFVQRVFAADGPNESMMEHFVSQARSAEMEYLLSVPQIRERCMRDKHILFRIVRCLPSYNILLLEYVVKALQLDEPKLKELQKYKDKKPAECDDDQFSANEYWDPDLWTFTDAAISKILSVVHENKD